MPGPVALLGLENTLLRLPNSPPGVCIPLAGVAPGITLFRMMLFDGRCALIGKTRSFATPAEDDRVKIGCAGLEGPPPGAKDMRDPECERVCVNWLPAWLLACRLDWEVERFMADMGIGMADDVLPFIPPRVWEEWMSVFRLPLYLEGGIGLELCSENLRRVAAYLAWSADRHVLVCRMRASGLKVI